ncbi:protein transport protein HofC [Enterobacter sp.]|uniref:protein transport protein HofC n=1 Tax=Enterobacter sp. TaxID=42895 RepID=UPI00296E9B09|nr:protein transport protein HofC [Enterobacter sp.]
MRTKQLWQWRGLDHAGENCEGLLWAEDKIAATLTLEARQQHPLQLKRCPVHTRLWQGMQGLELIRQLATLLQAGLVLPEGLRLLADQHPAHQWRALLQELADQLESGVALSVAMAQWPEVFSPLYVAMIRTGELTGKLDECCLGLASQQKAQQQLKAKVKKALRYPLIVLSLALVIVLAMVYLVLPEFAAIYSTFNVPLPTLTRGVMGLSDVIHKWGGVVMAFTGLIAVALKLLRRHQGWLRYRQRVLLRSPVFGLLIRGQMLSQIFTVLALTQKAGIAFLQGLESVEETFSCPFWRGVLHDVHQEVSLGSPIWLALKNSGQFTPLCIQLVRTGEASGALDTMLDNLAGYHSEKTQHQADNLASLLEPLMLIVTGVIIGTLVVAMYLPIFHLGDAMSG